MKQLIPPEYTRYLGLGLQFSVSILVGTFVGYFLDRKFASQPWGTVGGAALGFIVGLYGFLKSVTEPK